MKINPLKYIKSPQVFLISHNMQYPVQNLDKNIHNLTNSRVKQITSLSKQDQRFSTTFQKNDRKIRPKNYQASINSQRPRGQ
jgi:hypothetical protein